MSALAPQRSRGAPVLVGALVVDSIGNGLFLPLSLVYFVRLTPVPLAVVGVVLSLASILPLPVPIWAGWLADRIGPKPVVITAQLLQAVGYAAYTVVQEPIGILLAAATVGIGVRFFWSAVFALLADFAEASAGDRSKDAWFTLSNIARTVGLALGGLLTGILVASGAATAYRATAWCAVGAFLLAALLLALAVAAPHVRHEQVAGQGYAGMLRDRPFLALILVNTVLALSSFFLPLALPTVVTRQLGAPPWVTSLLLAGNAVLVAVLSTPLVRRASGRRRTRVLVVAAVLWAVGSLLLALLAATGPALLVPLLVVGALLFIVAEAIHAPLSQTLAEAVAPVASRGRYLATFQYSFALASIVGPGFFAVLFELAHPLPWVGLALLDVAALVGVLLLERRLPQGALRSAARPPREASRTLRP